MTSLKDFSMHDLKAKLGSLGPNELILDVRTPEEFAEGHIPGAKNIDHESVSDHYQELKKYERIYCHCRSGKRSQIATRELEGLGLKNIVCISNGGMLDWYEAGYPVER